MSRGQHYNVVAIDGPAASGKSSVARELARHLGFVYVNSGAMYRGVTWFLLQRQVDPAAIDLIEGAIDQAEIECVLSGDELRLRIAGNDPTPHLREDNVNKAVSRVSAVPRVREILVAQMRHYARGHDLVTEGRDIGSVVFPDTPFKFYIDASPEVRSRRREAQGEEDAIIVRDKADSSRANAPLVIAKDAQVIDTSDMTIADVVAEISRHLRAKGLRSRTSASLSSRVP